MKLTVIHNPERTTERLKAVKRALVWCHQDAEALPYHLIDICTEGLSFRYLGAQLDSEVFIKVSLYHEKTLIVDSIPVELVSDFLLEEDDLVPVRRANLHFKSLSNDQYQSLQCFIKNFTEQPPTG